LSNSRFHEPSVNQFARITLGADFINPFAGDRFIDLRFNHVGEHLEHRLGHVVRRRRARALAKLFHHRLQFIKLPRHLLPKIVAIASAVICFQVRRWRRVITEDWCQVSGVGCQGLSVMHFL
jgi:hypothetical protein